MLLLTGLEGFEPHALRFWRPNGSTYAQAFAISLILCYNDYMATEGFCHLPHLPRCPGITPNGPCKLPVGWQTDHLGEGYCRHHPDGKMSMKMPADPILLSIIPKGLNDDLVQQLMEDDDLNRLSRMIVVCEARVAEMSTDPKAADVKPLTSLVDAMRKLISTKTELEIQRHSLIDVAVVKQVLAIFNDTFYDVIDDPHKRDEFRVRLNAKIQALRIVKRGPKAGKMPDIIPPALDSGQSGQ